MIAKKCDRCAVYYEPYNEELDFGNPNGFSFANIDGAGDAYKSNPYDLCPKCMGEFMSWYTGEEISFEEGQA